MNKTITERIRDSIKGKSKSCVNEIFEECLSIYDEYPLPNMVLSRGDIEDEKLRESMTDDDMIELARLLSKALMQNWAEDFDTILGEYVRKEK